MLDQKFVDIITSSIEAAVQPDLYHKSVDLLVDSYGGLSGNILVLDADHEARVALAVSRFIREDAREMYEKFLEKEDADDTIALKKLFDSPYCQIFSEYQLFKVRKYRDLPPSSFRDWQKSKFDIVHRYSAKLNSHGPWLDCMFIHIDSNKGQLSQQELTEFNQLSPILASSIKTFRIMEQLRTRFNATLSALDNLGIACLLTINDAQIIHRNKQAQDMFDARDGIGADHSGRLSVVDKNMALAIAEACSSAYQTANAQSLISETVLPINRPSGKPPFLMIISPIIDSNAELEFNLRCAMVFVVDPALSKNLSIDGLIILGNLTPAEAEICQMLVQGLATKEIMERRNVSENTIRQQIKAIMSKLSCKNRIDVLRTAVDTRLPINT